MNNFSRTKTIIWNKLREDAIIPTQEEDSAGYDLYTVDDDVTIRPGCKAVLHTGVRAILPQGYWLSIWERSSTGNLQMTRHAGVVDESYRGEIMILLANYTNHPITITSAVKDKVINKNESGEIVSVAYPKSKAIAQGIFIEKPHFDNAELNADDWEALNNEWTSQRGAGWDGHTGK